MSQFKCPPVIYDPYIGPYQVLPLWARVKSDGNEGELRIP